MKGETPDVIRDTVIVQGESYRHHNWKLMHPKIERLIPLRRFELSAIQKYLFPEYASALVFLLKLLHFGNRFYRSGQNAFVESRMDVNHIRQFTDVVL